MKAKRILKAVLCGACAFVFALFGVVLFNVETVKSGAESSPIVSLFTPTMAGAGYTLGGFGDWQVETTVEDYADSPTGKVVHQVIDNTQSAGGETWPGLKFDISTEEAVTDFAGYIVWIEYSGEVYSDSTYWGLFNHRLGSDNNVVGNAKPITFIDENGKITETKSGGWCYHRNNMTAIEGTEYESAYSYSFKGYMLIPAESWSGTGNEPAPGKVMDFSHHYKKTISADIKIGSIGYYTDYAAALNELGRCTYTFVDHDGTVIKTETVKPNTTVVAPEYENTFSKGNHVYSFVGWSGFVNGMTITEDRTFTASYKMIDFQMVKGASIRTTEGSSGIRFIAEFDENLYNEVSLSDNKQFGMLITKFDYYQAAMEANEDLVAGLESLGNNKYILITETSKNPVKPYMVTTETTVRYRINGAITNIQYSHADWTWIGVGVVMVENGDSVEYIYSAHNVEDSARTAAFVASSALNDPTGDYSETEKTVLKNYVYATAAKLSGVTEAEFNGSQDKAGYMSAYSLTLGEGFDTSKKFNKNVEGKEAYLAIGETKTIDAKVQNSEGETLDVACSVSVGKTDALEVNGLNVTGLKNGYAEVTITCDLFGYSEKVTVYTGSTDAGNRSESYKGSNVNASVAKAESGEIDGIPYYWMQYQVKDSAHIFAHYSDMSVYYIDYLISQGYKYLRIPFYFDTTRYEEFGVTADDIGKDPYITIWMAKGLDGSSGGSSKHIKGIPVNEWCYFDMDIHHYRMNYVEATGDKVDTYGKKLASSSYYQYLQMKFCGAYIAVYTSDMTFVKSSGLTIDESNDELAFGENVNLAEWYGTDEAAVFTVDGVKMHEMTAVKANHAITINANVITAKIGNGAFKDEDGNYVVGNKTTWGINYQTVTPVEKTMMVKDGIVDNTTVLVDVKDVATPVALGSYTLGAELQQFGFEVSHSYVKRYSDGTPVVAETVANNERGIFYVTVNAKKGLQEVEYNVTLDLYNSAEVVEYESFGHADSKYAVKAYYAIKGSKSEGLYDSFDSYDHVSNYYVTGTTNSSGQALYGLDLDFDTYFSLKKYGDDSIDKNSDNKPSLGNAYSYDVSSGSYTYTEDDFKKIAYLSLDGNKFQLDTPIKENDGTEFDSYTIDAVVYIYITPRHTKEYYQEFSSSTLLKTAYAEPRSGGSVVANFLTGVSGDVNNPTVSKTKRQNYSANWQASLMWSSGNAGPQSITVETIATYYDSFANRNFPFISWSRPAGRGASDLSNKAFKLGMLIF